MAIKFIIGALAIVFTVLLLNADAVCRNRNVHHCMKKMQVAILYVVLIRHRIDMLREMCVCTSAVCMFILCSRVKKVVQTGSAPAVHGVQQSKREADNETTQSR